MECPKCSGVSYMAEEEFLQVLETEPVKVVTKGVYVCKLCTDRFTRIHVEDIHAKRKVEVQAAQKPKEYRQARQEEIAESLRFF